MLGNGIKIYSMDLELKNGQIIHPMRGNSKYK
jgi:hypothetical protein